jgi:hypothetical protein
VETPATAVKPHQSARNSFHLLRGGMTPMLRGRGGDIWGIDLRLAASHFPKYRPFLKKNALSFQSFSSGNYFVLIIAQSDRDDNIIAGNITNMPHLWRWYLRVIFISIDMACRWHLRDILCLRHLTPMGFSSRGRCPHLPLNIFLRYNKPKRLFVLIEYIFS